MLAARHRVLQLVILTHQRQGLAGDAMVRRLWEEHWRPAGLRVAVQQGLRKAPPGDLALLHVDLTQIPPEYLALADSYPRCLNRAVTDISKRRISRRLVRAEDPYDGPVIVKTDRNYAGLPERRLALAEGGWTARLAEALRRHLPAAWSRRLPGDCYQVLPRKSLVPAWVWRQPALLVERLALERRGEHYAMHQWYFCGARDCVATVIGAEPMINFEHRVALLPPSFEVPDSLRQMRRALGFDLGKFDYVMEDGEAVLLDVNRTPAIAETDGERTRLLAPGIQELLSA